MTNKESKRKRASFSSPKKDESEEKEEKHDKDIHKTNKDGSLSAKVSSDAKAMEDESADKKESSAPFIVVEEESARSDHNEKEKQEDALESKKSVKDTVSDFASSDTESSVNIEKLDKASSKKNLLILIVVAAASFVFGLVVALGIGKFIQTSEQSKETANIGQEISSPEPLESPEPEKKEIKREDISLEVLNGSGVKGAAGKARSFLQDLGYEVVDIGNAKTSDYKMSVLVVSEDTDKAIIELLQEDLGKDYTLATPSTKLENDVGFIVRFIVGKE